MKLLAVRFVLFSVAPGDFSLLTEQLTFNPGNGSQHDCAIIMVENDLILEDDESFSVVLTTTDPDIIRFGPNITVVTITDDDSKQSCNIHDNGVMVLCCVLSHLTPFYADVLSFQV